VSQAAVNQAQGKLTRATMLSVIRGMALRGFMVSAAITALCLAAPAVFAAELYGAPKAAESAPAAGAGGLAQVTLSLLLVLAAVFAAAWVVRRLRGFGKFGGGALQVVTEIAVGTKERVVLVQVGNQQLLLGVAPGRVNTLHVLTEPVVTQPPTTALTPTADGSTPPNVDFKAILKRSLGL
jgi:flagellar protein FliO/FliZ